MCVCISRDWWILHVRGSSKCEIGGAVAIKLSGLNRSSQEKNVSSTHTVRSGKLPREEIELPAVRH